MGQLDMDNAYTSKNRTSMKLFAENALFSPGLI